VVAKKSIRAPFSGRLGITTLNPGQYVNAGDKLVTLQTLDPIYVDFALPQQQLAGLAVGQVVNLSVDTFPGQGFSGKINAISPKVDAATRNVQVEATVSNPKQLLLPGMFANVKIDVGGVQEQLTLPSTAVTYNPYGSTVYVVKEAEPPKEGAAGAPAQPASPSGAKQLVAQQVFVETGATRGDQIAIVKGLTAGQVVVSSGQNKLKNGTPVVVDNSVQPANNRRRRRRKSEVARMNFTDIFIRRPVLAMVVSMLIVVLGLRALAGLPVNQYPKTENGVVTITTAYYGADAATVAGFITQPLEAAVSQAQGIDYLSSSSSLGVSTITATLRLNYDSNRALTEINTQVNRCATSCRRRRSSRC